MKPSQLLLQHCTETAGGNCKGSYDRECPRSAAGVQQGQDAGLFDSLIYRALHNLRYAITNPAAMPSPSAIFATRPLR
jgi:hypothetical protein